MSTTKNKYCLIIKMRLYCKKYKRHTSNTFPKKKISNNKIKGKCRCFICLTERSFIDEFNMS